MHPILKLIAQRVALGLMLLFAASILIFGGTMMLPGDVAQQILLCWFQLVSEQNLQLSLMSLQKIQQPYLLHHN